MNVALDVILRSNVVDESILKRFNESFVVEAFTYNYNSHEISEEKVEPFMRTEETLSISFLNN